jgi:hypothetical protein
MMEHIVTCCIDYIVWQSCLAVAVSLILVSNGNLSSVLTIWHVCPYFYITGSNHLCMFWPYCFVVHHMRLTVGSFLPSSIWSLYRVRGNVCQLAEKLKYLRANILLPPPPLPHCTETHLALNFQCLSAGGTRNFDDTRTYWGKYLFTYFRFLKCGRFRIFGNNRNNSKFRLCRN